MKLVKRMMLNNINMINEANLLYRLEIHHSIVSLMRIAVQASEDAIAQGHSNILANLFFMEFISNSIDLEEYIGKIGSIFYAGDLYQGTTVQSHARLYIGPNYIA